MGGGWTSSLCAWGGRWIVWCIRLVIPKKKWERHSSLTVTSWNRHVHSTMLEHARMNQTRKRLLGITALAPWSLSLLPWTPSIPPPHTSLPRHHHNLHTVSNNPIITKSTQHHPQKQNKRKSFINIAFTIPQNWRLTPDINNNGTNSIRTARHLWRNWNGPRIEFEAGDCGQGSK